MLKTIPSWLKQFRPEPINADYKERLRACAGAFAGILLTGLITYWLLGASIASTLLIAPMGASAVLLFAVPSSPLAQPWSIMGGNVIAAFIGVGCATLIGHGFFSAALAIFLSIAAMFSLRCLHPPSGAVALTAVIGGPAIYMQGYGFVLCPVALNSLILLLTAIVFNNATRRPYPHSAVSLKATHGTTDALPEERFGFNEDDISSVLKQYNQVLDISRDDLQSLFHQTELHAFQRRFGKFRCADIMSRDVISVDFGTHLDEAWTLLRQHNIKALPVIDRANRVIGIVTPIDFTKHADLDALESYSIKLKRFLQRTTSTHSEKPEVVGQIMSSPVVTARDEQQVIELMPLMSEHDVHHIPIINKDRRLVGIITQSDLLSALYYQRLDQR